MIKDALKDEPSIKLGRAFFEACRRCGVDPLELEPRTVKSFRLQTDLVYDEKQLNIRSEGYEANRQKKLAKVLAEQEDVDKMLRSGVDPFLVPVQEPWLVGKDAERKAPKPGHSAQATIDAMVAEQAARERAVKESERAALEAAVKRQAKEIDRMVLNEKALAEKAKAAAIKEAEKAADRKEEEKIKEKKKKEDAAKLVTALEKKRLEEIQAEKDLMATLQREKEQDHASKARLIEEERDRQRKRLEDSKAADEAARARREKTEAVYAGIEAKQDANLAKLEGRELAVAEAARVKGIEAAKRNAERQLASNERIAAVLAGQAKLQADKRTKYEAHQEANRQRREEKAADEAEELAKQIKKREDDATRRAQAYENMQTKRMDRRDKIKEHAAVRGQVYGEISKAREEEHRAFSATAELKRETIRENVTGYMAIQEQKRMQQAAKIYDEDLRALTLKNSKKALLVKRNIAAHQVLAEPGTSGTRYKRNSA